MGGLQKIGEPRSLETTSGKYKCGKQMLNERWHRSCPERRTDVGGPFETDGGTDG